MTVFVTIKPLAREASADVLHAASHSVIAALYQASIVAGEVGHQIDCIGLAHKVAKGGAANLDSVGYRLSSDLLDKVLLHRASDPQDVVTLCLVAAERMGVIEDNSEPEMRPIADAVTTALLNIAGFVLAEQGRGFISRLAEPLRVRAADCLDNYAYEPDTAGGEA